MRACLPLIWQQLLGIAATSQQAWVYSVDAVQQARMCIPVRLFLLKVQYLRLVMLPQLDGIVPDGSAQHLVSLEVRMAYPLNNISCSKLMYGKAVHPSID